MKYNQQLSALAHAVRIGFLAPTVAENPAVPATSCTSDTQTMYCDYCCFRKNPARAAA